MAHTPPDVAYCRTSSSLQNEVQISATGLKTKQNDTKMIIKETRLDTALPGVRKKCATVRARGVRVTARDVTTVESRRCDRTSSTSIKEIHE